MLQSIMEQNYADANQKHTEIDAFNFSPHLKQKLRENFNIKNAKINGQTYPLLVLKNHFGEFILSDELINFGRVKVSGIGILRMAALSFSITGRLGFQVERCCTR